MDELRKIFGLADQTSLEERGSCTVTLECAGHTKSCTSATGDCSTRREHLSSEGANTGGPGTVVAIICDNQEYTCLT